MIKLENLDNVVPSGITYGGYSGSRVRKVEEKI